MAPKRTAAKLRALKRKQKENDGATITLRKSRRIEQKTACEIVEISDDDESESLSFRRFMKSVTEELERINDNEDNDDYCVSMKSLTQLSRTAAKMTARDEVYHLETTNKAILIDVVMRSVIAADTDLEGDICNTSIYDILKAAEACLVVCHLYLIPQKSETAPNDDMKQIVTFVQMQMRNTIFPSKNPHYFFFASNKRNAKNQSVSVAEIRWKIAILYEKLVDIVNVLITMFDRFSFIDSIVFEILAVCAESLFVDDIGALQSSCHHLITLIFRTNTNVRRRIFYIILKPIDSMPLLNRNKQSFRFAPNDESILSVTALVLQLLQISAELQENFSDTARRTDRDKFEMEIMENWETAVRFGKRFLRKFFGKCESRFDDVNKCDEVDLPAILKSIGTMTTPTNRIKRSASIRALFENFIKDLLATIHQPEWSASVLLLNQLSDILVECMTDINAESTMRILSMKYLGNIVTGMREKRVESWSQQNTINELIKQVGLERELIFTTHSEDEKTAFLQEIVLDYLAVANQSSLVARQFYWMQLINEVMLRKRSEKSLTSQGRAAYDKRKENLMLMISPHYRDIYVLNDERNVRMIAQYLVGEHQFSELKYYEKIIEMEREPSFKIQIMKILVNFAKVDPFVLNHEEVSQRTRQAFSIASMPVREAAVDLIGECVLKRPDLIDCYYELLSTAKVSVQKRIVKVYTNICIEHSEFEKIPEMCVKMMIRANEDTMIREVVASAFMQMWFTPCAANKQARIGSKINQMLDFIGMTPEASLKWLKGLLAGSMEGNGIALEESDPLVEACQQIVDGLVCGLERHEFSYSVALNSVKLLHLLAIFRPALLVQHVPSLLPYLDVMGHLETEKEFVCYLMDLLEMVMMMNHPDETTLSELEQQLFVLALNDDRDITQKSLSYLSTVIKEITSNYILIRRISTGLIKTLIDCRTQLQATPNGQIETIQQGKLNLFLLVIGLIFRFFDFKQAQVRGENADVSLPPTIRDEVFELLMFFASLTTHNDIRSEALLALGHFCITNFDFLTNSKLHGVYRGILTSTKYDKAIKRDVLRNITMYLEETDVSENSFQVSKLYLVEIMRCSFDADENVRSSSSKAVEQILRHKIDRTSIVPFLICFSTEEDQDAANRIKSHLETIYEQYPHEFIWSVSPGMQLSLELQAIRHHGPKMKMTSGYTDNDELLTARNRFLYTLVRSDQLWRRTFIDSILSQFNGQHSSTELMLYLAGNLAYFPYEVCDEPLYVLKQICEWFIEKTEEGEEQYPLEPHDHQALKILSALRKHLQAMYGISNKEILCYMPWNPTAKDNAAVEKSPMPSFDPKIDEVAMIGVSCSANGKNALIEQCCNLQEVCKMMKFSAGKGAKGT